jgi:hypothetical protein
MWYFNIRKYLFNNNKLDLWSGTYRLIISGELNHINIYDNEYNNSWNKIEGAANRIIKEVLREIAAELDR